MTPEHFFIVGAGFFGAVLAERIARELQSPVTIFEQRAHFGGNSYSALDPETGIECHRFGSHIFHTSIPKVWHYITKFTEFTGYRHLVLTKHKGQVFSLPINLATINQLYQKNFTPKEAEDFLAEEIAKDKIANPKNLEEKAISLIGRTLYTAFIQNYTKKQWACDPKELPAEIITRLPVRTSYNNNYFADTWQGLPKDGYFTLFKNLLAHPNITIKYNCSYASIKAELPTSCKIIYTGIPDALFDYKFGRLPWRSLNFEWETLPIQDYQGIATMNYADADVPYTRIHEFKHYHPERQIPFNLKQTIICREYPKTYTPNDEPYYPINNAANNQLYALYAAEAKKDPRLILGGRLGLYKYFDMDKTIAAALETFEDLKASLNL